MTATAQTPAAAATPPASVAGWFFADRVNLPLVTEPDAGPNAPTPTHHDRQLAIINLPLFPDRNWSAEWFSWLALNDFAATG